MHPEVGYLDAGGFGYLIGDLRNGRVASLPVHLLYQRLEAFLRSSRRCYSPEVGTIPDRLLEHNRQPRNLATCEFAAIDADLVFAYDAASNAVDIEWKAYFAHPQFARPPEAQRVVLHIMIKEATGLTRAVSAPLQALMHGYGDVSEGYQGYAHKIAFFGDDREFINEVAYVGVTKRHWLVRMDEHMAEIRSGSNKRFHAAWRAYAGNAKVMLSSELIVLNHTYEGVMAWEEEQVDAQMANGTSLNMIPGGFKGLRFLHEHRLTDQPDITLEERDIAIAEYVQRGGVRPAVPNLFLAELWRDDSFYLKVLAGRSDVLSPAQVLAIRELAIKGHGAAQICEMVDARNVAQVERVVAGKTYSRVKGVERT